MKELSILGVKINQLKKTELLDLVEKAIDEKSNCKLYTVNNEFVVEAQTNLDYKKALNDSTISIPDSTGIVWAAKKMHKEELERIPGADLFFDLLKIADKKSLNIFFLGGERGVGEASKREVLKKYKNIKNITVIDGVNISPSDEGKDIVEKINQSNASIVFVALGSPKQELWIENHLPKLNPAVIIGIGGTLDFVSGKIKRAPKFMREVGLEWLYRLLKQPSRAGRIYKAVVTFPSLVNKAVRLGHLD